MGASELACCGHDGMADCAVRGTGQGMMAWQVVLCGVQGRA